MVVALETGGLWRVLWYSIALASVVGAFSAVLRAFGVEWRMIRWCLISLYTSVYVWWFLENGIIIDRISVLWSFAIFLCVASVGRPAHEWWRTARDLGFFVAMWLAYDESRGIADGLGMPVQVESVRNIDRFLFFGTDGVVWLQERFLAPVGTVRWYDVIAAFVYYSHFVLPPLVMAVLWLTNRDQWIRYMRRFATVILIGCVGFILFPTAPPWMAAGGVNGSGYAFDALPPVRRPTGNGWRHIGLESFVEAWDVGRDWANEVAAMPSLHSAYALFVVVFFWPKIRPVGLRYLALLYPFSMAVALMYFGEHYFADALAGWATVGVSFLIWNRIERRWDATAPVPAGEPTLEEPESLESASA
ncbi:phosphatase PAP2 family protein [Ilumatobacter nonamiensis]|uniref:phosphatase PAP2 family protein n=1 Tax=Ilumatobacter nonamiensis TaxID=467093 RepID=UPI0006884731|nr:phosphatase PAP2 family protein [Ilumatobacter nonamiensis]